VAAADAYDVVIRGRPYRPKSPPAEAFQELMSGAGSQFDARVIAALGRVLGDARNQASL
jgi:HD-GYP domain-containing protein (c-di-GMP phosphodiesterase class II)